MLLNELSNQLPIHIHEITLNTSLKFKFKFLFLFQKIVENVVKN